MGFARVSGFVGSFTFFPLFQTCRSAINGNFWGSGAVGDSLRGQAGELK